MKSALFFFLIGLSIAMLAWFFFWHIGVTSEPLEEAYRAYSAGEQAKTVAERKKEFNKALALYTEVENKNSNDGRLYYNIGNTYFQLEEYPLAIYNYYRADALRPGDDKIQQNLHFALEKAGVKPEKEETIFSQIFYPHFYLSLADRLRAFFFSGIALLAFISAYIWFKQKWVWNLIILSGLVYLFFLSSTLYSRFISPVEGVMIQSALLYRDAGTEYAKVKNEPLLGGSKVEVLDILKDGQWLKIKSPDGTLGYVPQKTIKLL